jgi:hypothetical protein
MARKRKTKLIRVYSELDTELKMKFPGIRSADLYQVMYQSSFVRWEAALRANDRKKKKKTR